MPWAVCIDREERDSSHPFLRPSKDSYVCQTLFAAEELSEAVAMEPPVLKELITAFSREQKEKV